MRIMTVKQIRIFVYCSLVINIFHKVVVFLIVNVNEKLLHLQRAIKVNDIYDIVQVDSKVLHVFG